MERLRNTPHVVGLKQSEKAIKRGFAIAAFLAEDTDSYLAEPFLALCEEYGISVETVASRKTLAKACRVEVPVACAVLVAQDSV